MDGSIYDSRANENLRATVAEQAATIDYLADGNDGMTAFLQADKRECPDGATLRGLFMKYVEKQTAAGKKVTSRMEGRVVVKE